RGRPRGRRLYAAVLPRLGAARHYRLPAAGRERHAYFHLHVGALVVVVLRRVIADEPQHRRGEAERGAEADAEVADHTHRLDLRLERAGELAVVDGVAGRVGGGLFAVQD